MGEGEGQYGNDIRMISISLHHSSNQNQSHSEQHYYPLDEEEYCAEQVQDTPESNQQIVDTHEQ